MVAKRAAYGHQSDQNIAATGAWILRVQLQVQVQVQVEVEVEVEVDVDVVR